MRGNFFRAGQGVLIIEKSVLIIEKSVLIIEKNGFYDVVSPAHLCPAWGG